MTSSKLYVHDYFKPKVSIDEDVLSSVISYDWIQAFADELLIEPLPKEDELESLKRLYQAAYNAEYDTQDSYDTIESLFLYSVLVLLSFGAESALVRDYFFSLFPGCVTFIDCFEDEFYLLIANTLSGTKLSEEFYPRKPYLALLR